MPIYEYHCEKCDKVIEVSQRITDDPLTTCPSCEDGGRVRKLISRSAFHLKGSGWYTTDYGRPSNGSSASESKATESKPTEKSEAAPACGQGSCEGCAAASDA